MPGARRRTRPTAPPRAGTRSGPVDCWSGGCRCRRGRPGRRPAAGSSPPRRRSGRRTHVAGVRQTSSGDPTCSTRPSRSTAIRSPSTIASVWSCVTWTIVASTRVCSAFSSARVSTRSSTSRFDNGSSRRKTSGSRTSARASATRCRSPPESWPGRRSSRFAQPTAAAARSGALPGLGLRDVAHLQPERDVLDHRQVREQRVRLEHHRHVAPARAERGHVPTGDHVPAPRWSRCSPATTRSSVDLPAPDGPSTTSSSPLTHLEVDARAGPRCPRAPRGRRQELTAASISSPACSPRAKTGRVSSSISAITWSSGSPR